LWCEHMSERPAGRQPDGTFNKGYATYLLGSLNR
jgi:hypothetical protein